MYKSIITICAAIIISVGVFAQAPDKMSYQAVVRDGNNNLVSSTAIGMQISILQGSTSGTAVYVESQTPTSNSNGLVSIEIGGGSPLTGNFSTINWANGPYFIKTETDPMGGTNYTITSTSQLLSVPFALYAEKSGSSEPTYTVGQFAQGGIVFWVDETGHHGLVVSKINLTSGSGLRWFAGTYTNTIAKGLGVRSGVMNTTLIIANQGIGDNGGYAAKSCSEYSSTEGGVTYGDWYLPSVNELLLMDPNLPAIDSTSLANGGDKFSMDGYWSSTEFNINEAYYVSFNLGSGNLANKNLNGHVRAIRAF